MTVNECLCFHNLPKGAETSVFIHNRPPLSKAGILFVWIAQGLEQCRDYIPTEVGGSSPPPRFWECSVVLPINHSSYAGFLESRCTPFTFPSSRSGGGRYNAQYKRSQHPFMSGVEQALPACRPGQLPGEKTPFIAADDLTLNQRQADRRHEPYAKHIRRATSVPCIPSSQGPVSAADKYVS